MKEVAAILIFACITVPVMHQTFTSKFETGKAVALILVAIVAGFVAANYDVIRKLKFKDFEVERLGQQVAEAALTNIQSAVEAHEQHIKQIVRDANATAAKLDEQREALEKKISASQEQVVAAQKQITNASAELEKITKATIELKEDMAPRSIKNTADTVASLSQFKGQRVAVISATDEGEATKLRDEIKAVLAAAKWKIETRDGPYQVTGTLDISNSTGTRMVLPDPVLPGIEQIRATSESGVNVYWSELSEANIILTKALNTAGVLTSFFRAVPVQDFTLIVVGRKPSREESLRMILDIRKLEQANDHLLEVERSAPKRK
jgi:hypothetical protein